MKRRFDTSIIFAYNCATRSRKRFLGERKAAKGESIDDYAVVSRVVYSHTRVDPERTSLGPRTEEKKRETHIQEAIVKIRRRDASRKREEDLTVNVFLRFTISLFIYLISRYMRRFIVLYYIYILFKFI